ncbi:MAG: 2-succinyl-6-hydroxy-2,4-cyclohexadiene-1-carboxylate synthase [Myxococcales bacterium]
MTLATATWGRGAPLALLHGFTGAGSAFDHLRDTLGARFRVIAPDLPGHGASPEATGWDDALEALRHALPSEPFFLAGYSMGGRLALAFALRHPARVRALVLESGSPGIEDPAERDRRRAQDDRLAAFALREGVAAFVARWEEHPTLSGLRALAAPLASALRERRLGSSAAGLASALRHLGAGAQPSLWDELPRLRVPALLLAGEGDAKFSEIARSMAERIPGARLRILPGCGHSPHLEAPVPYAEAAFGFFT